MILYLTNFYQKMWRWFCARVHTTHAKVWLAVISFTESSFFIIPPDVLLIAMLLAKNSNWRYLALLTTVASVAGAMFGYIIGAFFFSSFGESIITFYGLEHAFIQVGDWFDRFAFSVMFIAAFTPIPFKVFVLAGGFFKINFFAFLIASIIGRGARFFLVAWVTARYGERTIKACMRFADVLTIVVTALVAAAIGYFFFF